MRFSFFVYFLLSSSVAICGSKDLINGNCYVISIGIDHYPAVQQKYDVGFDGCVSDAIRFDELIKQHFFQGNIPENLIRKSKSGKEFQYKSFLFLNEEAHAENIVSAINQIIDESQPDDYFIFNYAGFTSIEETDNPVFYFYGIDNPDNKIELKEKGITLSKLKDLLQLIPANNQLIVTEAGNTADFGKKFVKALIEGSGSISNLSNKNRVIVTPINIGQATNKCGSSGEYIGMLNCFMTSLPLSTNIFQIFETDSDSYPSQRAKMVERQVLKNEMECNCTMGPYTSLFFERQLVQDLRYYLPDNLQNTRGARAIQKDKAHFQNSVSARHALIIGTGTYRGKPDWDDLPNPKLDAEALAHVLKNEYDYEVNLLLDPTEKTIYGALFQYQESLQPHDQLLIFIAGHGDFDEDYFDDGFIVLTDSKPISQDSIRKTYIQYAALQRVINKLPPNQLLVIFDVCFGGTFDERVAKYAGRNRSDTYANMSRDEFLSKKLQYKTRVYLTSGGKNVVPDGYAGKHSPFALKLLEALHARGGVNGMLTANDLFAFVQKLPSGPLLGNFGDHEIGGEYILMPNEEDLKTSFTEE